jgi:basic secretory peptidase family protein
MRRSTTFVVTETSVATKRSRAASRRRIGAVLGAEFICAVFLVGGTVAAPSGPAVAAPVIATQPAPAARTVAMPKGRSAQLVDLGAPGGDVLLDRVSTELPAAITAIDSFWGGDWRRGISIAVAGSPEQFRILGGGGPGIAATTTDERIMFSPAATAMNDADLRTVLRHELFHYAARADTAADAPVWLTEGVADFVGRPAAATAAPAPTSLPTDAELATAEPERSAGYDRAWQFASYVADIYGAEKLRALYLAACGHGHTDVATAVRDVLGVEVSAVVGQS